MATQAHARADHMASIEPIARVLLVAAWALLLPLVLWSTVATISLILASLGLPVLAMTAPSWWTIARILRHQTPIPAWLPAALLVVGLGCGLLAWVGGESTEGAAGGVRSVLPYVAWAWSILLLGISGLLSRYVNRGSRS